MDRFRDLPCRRSGIAGVLETATWQRFGTEPELVI
jgi:hypothetical protein